MAKYKYVGGGEFYHGIPARDLSEADWARLSQEQQKLVAAGPLYEAVEKKAAGKSKANKEA